ncbi:hypothetical protein KHA93_05935 [Bacillus sp. FJAT-49732]|uniref:DUF4367 domain-containing protein n=1 Tax=Lederbergia citrisecunda TaxID=2833583 RepID=A0A942TN15_9BACI|nr:hypothetical protein [Lederbergia citrisecunda]MBS4199194.1 hypothetical protein [Lederbergia citrisecunda]
MNKKKFFILLLGFSLFIGGWKSAKISLQKNVEKIYYDLGYKSIAEAIEETKSYFKTNLDLPKKLPPLNFSHTFGRFNRENENLEIEYLNEKKNFNYIINIFPARNERDFFSSTDTKISLKDGTDAYYSTAGKDEKVIIVLMFIKNNWTYILSIEEKLLDDPLPTLVEIANSL